MANSTFNLGNLLELEMGLKRQMGSDFEIDDKEEKTAARKTTTTKKVVKKKKKEPEQKAQPVLVQQVNRTTEVEEKQLVDNFMDFDKSRLKEAIIWGEILGEPKCKKRRRR